MKKQKHGHNPIWRKAFQLRSCFIILVILLVIPTICSVVVVAASIRSFKEFLTLLSMLFFVLFFGGGIAKIIANSQLEESKRKGIVELAGKLGIDYQDGNSLDKNFRGFSKYLYPHLEGTYNNRRFKIDWWGGGEHSPVYPRVRLTLNEFLLFDLSLSSRRRQPRGLELVPISDEDIEQPFFVFCESVSFATNLFQSRELRSRLQDLEFNNFTSINIKKLELIYKGPIQDFPPPNTELSLQSAEASLIWHLDLLCDLADTVEHTAKLLV